MDTINIQQKLNLICEMMTALLSEKVKCSKKNIRPNRSIDVQGYDRIIMKAAYFKKEHFQLNVIEMAKKLMISRRVNKIITILEHKTKGKCFKFFPRRDFLPFLHAFSVDHITGAAISATYGIECLRNRRILIFEVNYAYGLRLPPLNSKESQK